MKRKILFIGGTPRGFALLKRLIERKEDVVYACILKEDEHEHFKVSEEMSKLCKANGIENLICKKVEKDIVEYVLNKQPEVAFVCGWRTILPPDLYCKIPNGCLAAHDSLLPKNRGFAPTAWVIINGEKKTGVSLFKIDDKGVDAGDIFSQREIFIGEEETSEDIYPRVIKATVSLYEEFIDALNSNNVVFKKQDESLATYCSKRTPEDGEIDWDKTPTEIFNFIRALTPPYPYAWFLYKGKKYMVRKAYLLDNNDECGVPGEIINVDNDEMVVGCKNGSIGIKDIVDEIGDKIDIKKIFMDAENIKN